MLNLYKSFNVAKPAFLDRERLGLVSKKKVQSSKCISLITQWPLEKLLYVCHGLLGLEIENVKSITTSSMTFFFLIQQPLTFHIPDYII